VFKSLVSRIKSLMPVPIRSGRSWWSVIREPFTGAWQRNVSCETTENLCAFSAVATCIGLISSDIAKLRIKLVEFDGWIWEEVLAGSPFLPVLRKPNRYQTRIQFIEQWIISKLLYGNTYVLKERDQRGVVVAMYVLDPRLVVAKVADDGGVYYQLSRDLLAGVAEAESVTVPASEIIHDRMCCLWHPLVGVSPIMACAASATQGIRIQANSAKFFENMSRPSGQLTAPGAITDETAARLKREFEAGFGAGNIGRLFVAGDGLKYDAMTIPAQDAQLIEQLRWTVEDVARCFHVPLHKLGMGQPTLNNIAALNQDYYNQCIQIHLEAMELLLDEGLRLVDVPGKTLGVEMDQDGLLRMDPLTMADVQEKGTRSATFSPNENRRWWNLPAVTGGNSPMIQQQNYSLEAIAKRDGQDDPFGTAKPEPAAIPAPMPTPDEAAAKFLLTLKNGYEEMNVA